MMLLFYDCCVCLHHYLGDILWSYLSFDINDSSLWPLLLLLRFPVVPAAVSFGLPYRLCQLIQTLRRPHWCLMHALNPLRHTRSSSSLWRLGVFSCLIILGGSFLIAKDGIIFIRDSMVIIELLVLIFQNDQVLPRDQLLLLREGLREGRA